MEAYRAEMIIGQGVLLECKPFEADQRMLDSQPEPEVQYDLATGMIFIFFWVYEGMDPEQEAIGIFKDFMSGGVEVGPKTG